MGLGERHVDLNCGPPHLTDGLAFYLLYYFRSHSFHLRVSLSRFPFSLKVYPVPLLIRTIQAMVQVGWISLRWPYDIHTHGYRQSSAFPHYLYMKRHWIRRKTCVLTRYPPRRRKFELWVPTN